MSLAEQVVPSEGAMTYQRRPSRPDPAALARQHMPLVRKIAWHVHGRVSSALDVEDLVQIGMVALVEAANGYEDRGHAFSTYASMRIRGAMIDHLRRHATISGVRGSVGVAVGALLPTIAITSTAFPSGISRKDMIGVSGKWGLRSLATARRANGEVTRAKRVALLTSGAAA